VDICRALDGIPRAIELAASRLRSLSLTELSEHLSDQLHLLARHRLSQLREIDVEGHDPADTMTGEREDFADDERHWAAVFQRHLSVADQIQHTPAEPRRITPFPMLSSSGQQHQSPVNPTPRKPSHTNRRCGISVQLLRGRPDGGPAAAAGALVRREVLGEAWCN
jgi:hypothetical protein